MEHGRLIRMIVFTALVLGSAGTTRAVTGPEQPVLLAVRGRGVMRYQGKVLQPLIKDPRSFLLLARGRSTWGASGGGIHRLDGTPERVGSMLHPGMALFLDVNQDDVVWMANQKDAARFHAGKWTVVPLPRTLDEVVGDMKVGPQGRAWLVLGNRLLVTGDRGFMERDVTDWPQPAKHCKLVLATAPMVVCVKQVAVQREDGWQWYSTPHKMVPQFAVRGEDGLVYVSGGQDLFVLDPASPENIRKFTSPRGWIDAMAADTTGRIWIGTQEGLCVLDREGNAVKLPRALSALGEIDALLVRGPGPRL